MDGDSLFVNDHEFRVTLAETARGGWTMAILHIDRSGPAPVELRVSIDIEFASEAEALRYARVVVAEMAQRRDNGCTVSVD
ncbi:hypothetical protein [Paraburkholderia bannensis]|uniref:hypothetical protein n=1 Tax=Paraburkholderia bannensis TaxID=765414 RepID=UPI002AB7D26A|nr:hypothetical protein [Paraburkholderia bannensis]